MGRSTLKRFQTGAQSPSHGNDQPLHSGAIFIEPSETTPHHPCDKPMKPLILTFRATLACAVLLAAHSPAAAQEVPAAKKIVLVGDSTVASKSGWGDAFARLLAPGVECRNLALGGRSSKSYRKEGHWQKVLDAKPDWVLIQFGHNDMPGKGPERETDAKTTYRENLARYISDARSIGAKPVLVTSLTRRNFNAQGKIDAARLEPSTDSLVGKQLQDFLNDYVEATRAVAVEHKVPLLDLNARSIEQMNQLGPQAAVAFNTKSKDPAKPDTTHLSAEGAEKTAVLIAKEIEEKVPELAELVSP